LKDAKTGAVLASSNQKSAAPSGNGELGVLVDQGFSDLEDSLMSAYLDNVNRWLSKT